MTENYMINAILLAANLLSAGLLFFCMNQKGRTGKAAAPFAENSGWFPEFAVYGAGMIRMADLILQGIALPGRESRALLAVRILLAESMLLLFPLGKLMRRWKREESARENSMEWGSGELRVQAHREENGRRYWQACSEEENRGLRGQAHSVRGSRLDYILKEGEYYLGVLVLLGLTLQGWQEQELTRAFGRQAWLLLLFFCYGYLRDRRRQKENAGCFQDMESRIQDSGSGYPSSYGFNRNDEQMFRVENLRNMEQQYQRTRELWHDLKNHIRVLEILAQEGRFGELTDYLDSFRRDVERRMVPARTGCAPVDALLGDKLYHGDKQDVEMKLELCALSQSGIEAMDLCVILGNLLDNALEACAGLTGEKRIMLRIRQEEEFYYITVVNTAKEPVPEGEGYFSGKRGRDNGVGHGLGLRSAQRAAHRYGGLLVTDYSEGEFKAVVRLQGGTAGYGKP